MTFHASVFPQLGAVAGLLLCIASAQAAPVVTDDTAAREAQLAAAAAAAAKFPATGIEPVIEILTIDAAPLDPSKMPVTDDGLDTSKFSSRTAFDDARSRQPQIANGELPEPHALALVGVALGALALFSRRRSRVPARA